MGRYQVEQGLCHCLTSSSLSPPSLPHPNTKRREGGRSSAKFKPRDLGGSGDYEWRIQIYTGKRSSGYSILVKPIQLDQGSDERVVLVTRCVNGSLEDGVARDLGRINSVHNTNPVLGTMGNNSREVNGFQKSSPRFHIIRTLVLF